MALARKGVVVRGSKTPRYIREMLAFSGEIAATCEGDYVEAFVPSESSNRNAAINKGIIRRYTVIKRK